MAKPIDPTVQASKFMAFVLRHDPAAGGLTLDAEGWTPVAELLRGLVANGHPVSRADLDAILAGDRKGRYAYSADGLRIRANQGHSTDAVELCFEPAEPPEILYHGTVGAFLDAIALEGLRKMQRHHVHLSPDIATASAVGARRGKPVILLIAAQRMREAGHVFYRSANGVWLVEAVPPEYLTVPAAA